VQCVDCVAEQQAAGAPRSGRASGRGGAAPRRISGHGARRPVATYTIIGLTVLGYVLQQVLPFEDWYVRLVFVPVIGEDEPWRFLTVTLLHGGILHLAMNMWALWVVGPFLEDALGRVRYVALYLLSAVGGSAMLVILAQWDVSLWGQAVVGASGAIFGLFGAVVLVLRKIGGNARSMLLVIGVNLVFGFVVSGIAWQAHIGGLVAGVLLGAAYVQLPAAYRRWGSVAATVVLAGVIWAATAHAYGTLDLALTR